MNIVINAFAAFGVAMLAREVWTVIRIVKQIRANRAETQEFIDSIPPGTPAEEIARRYLAFRGLTPEAMIKCQQQDFTEADFDEAENKLSM